MRKVVCLIALFVGFSVLFAGKNQSAQAQEPDRFIALSEDKMPWEQAKDWCAAHGGRLPLINGASPLSLTDVWTKAPGTVSIDGIGEVDTGPNPVDFKTPWPSAELPGDHYWTGTEVSRYPGYPWFVFDNGGFVFVDHIIGQRIDCRVVCVP
jgi:hypothetical protein